MSQPERTYVQRLPTIQVVDPTHPQAENDALAWDKGVISLTADTLVYNDGGPGGEQVVDIPEGFYLVCYGDSVTTIDGERLHVNWEPEQGNA